MAMSTTRKDILHRVIRSRKSRHAAILGLSQEFVDSTLARLRPYGKSTKTMEPMPEEHLIIARLTLNKRLRQNQTKGLTVNYILEPEAEIMNQLLVKEVLHCIREHQIDMLCLDDTRMRHTECLQISEKFHALQSRPWSAQELKLARTRVQAAIERESSWKLRCMLSDPWHGSEEPVRSKELVMLSFTLEYKE